MRTLGYAPRGVGTTGLAGMGPGFTDGLVTAYSVAVLPRPTKWPYVPHIALLAPGPTGKARLSHYRRLSARSEQGGDRWSVTGLELTGGEWGTEARVQVSRAGKETDVSVKQGLTHARGECMGEGKCRCTCCMGVGVRARWHTGRAVDVPNQTSSKPTSSPLWPWPAPAPFSAPFTPPPAPAPGTAGTPDLLSLFVVTESQTVCFNLQTNTKVRRASRGSWEQPAQGSFRYSASLLERCRAVSYARQAASAPAGAPVSSNSC